MLNKYEPQKYAYMQCVTGEIGILNLKQVDFIETPQILLHV